MREEVKAALLSKEGAKKQSFHVSGISSVKRDRNGHKFVVLTFNQDETIEDWRDGKKENVSNMFFYEDKLTSLVNSSIPLFMVKSALSLGVLQHVLLGAKIELISIPVAQDTIFVNPVTGHEDHVYGDNIFQFIAETTVDDKVMEKFNTMVLPIIKKVTEALIESNIRRDIGMDD